MALNVLSKSAREVLTEGWKFNTRYGFELTPDAQYVWTDHAGKETTLNVFKPPVGFLSWELTVCPENGDLDMIVAPSVGYRELGQPVQVLFDRTYNRDGADAQRYTGVYIDGIVAVPFEEMPESARRYISVKAARQFSAQTVGAPELVTFNERDEIAALRILKREQGNKTNPNMLTNSVSAWGWFGGRPYWSSGSQRRVYRGGN